MSSKCRRHVVRMSSWCRSHVVIFSSLFIPNILITNKTRPSGGVKCRHLSSFPTEPPINTPFLRPRRQARRKKRRWCPYSQCQRAWIIIRTNIEHLREKSRGYREKRGHDIFPAGNKGSCPRFSGNSTFWLCDVHQL